MIPTELKMNNSKASSLLGIYSQEKHSHIYIYLNCKTSICSHQSTSGRHWVVAEIASSTMKSSLCCPLTSPHLPTKVHKIQKGTKIQKSYPKFLNCLYCLQGGVFAQSSTRVICYYVRILSMDKFLVQDFCIFSISQELSSILSHCRPDHCPWEKPLKGACFQDTPKPKENHSLQFILKLH